MPAQLFSLPHDFVWATGIENTFVPQTRAGMRGLDEYALTQHYAYWRTDFDLAASTGVRALRWGIPWYRVQPGPKQWDWAWVDEALDYLVNVKRITPIVDLMHYGTPLWLDNSFINASYPGRVAEYAAAVAERYQSLVQIYTPLNEPTINAHLCGRCGQWPPYLQGEDGYVKVLLALARGMVLSMQAIKAVQPGATTVQVEAVGRRWTKHTQLAARVERENAAQFLAFDLATGTEKWQSKGDGAAYASPAMVTVGGAIGGYCEIGNCRIEIAPASMTMMAMTQAKIGRSMKNLGIMVYFFSSLGFAPGAGGAPGPAAPGLPAAAGAAMSGAPGVQGIGLTVAPGRTFCKPLTITCSPPFSPSSTMKSPPAMVLVLIGRGATLPSASTVITNWLWAPPCTARCGTRIAASSCDCGKRMRTKVPGRRSRRGFGNSARRTTAPLFGSTARSENWRRPFSG